MWNNVIVNKIRIFIFLKTNCLSFRNVWEPSPHRCRNIITGTIWKIRKETFLKVHLISASETASGKTKGSNSLECWTRFCRTGCRWWFCLLLPKRCECDSAGLPVKNKPFKMLFTNSKALNGPFTNIRKFNIVSWNRAHLAFGTSVAITTNYPLLHL